ncbi:matrix metallopeptidase 19 [Orbilia javanica]|uniref:Matrix metallopeptidase 19 n=1 Tax=Orbilia javanica TaxID=47235 RepID=A0AAN8RFA7_9PEZI
MQDATTEDVIRESRPAIKRITEHLTCFNCYTPPSEAPKDELDEYVTLCTSIAKFQKASGIPETGIFDPVTANHLRQSHCHNNTSHKENIFTDDWYQGASLGYCFDQYPDNHLTVGEVRTAFETAFREWGKHITPPLRFEERSPHKDVDIRISWRYDFGKLSISGNKNDDDAVTECTDFDPESLKEKEEVVKWKDEWVAVAYSPSSKKNLHGDVKVYFNEWAPAADILQPIVFHHIGHILGLGHSGNGSAVMWPLYKNHTLHQDDVRAIKAKYQLAIDRTTVALGHTATSSSITTYGGWRQIFELGIEDVNATVQIAAAPGKQLYRRDEDGRVWQYDFAGKWEKVSGNCTAKHIEAASEQLFLVDRDGAVFERPNRGGLGRSNKLGIDTSNGFLRVTPDGKKVFAYHVASHNSYICSSDTSKKPRDWEQLQRHRCLDAQDIATTASQLFRISEDWLIYAYDNDETWHIIHGGRKFSRLVGSEDRLYKINLRGQVFEWDGTSLEEKDCQNWTGMPGVPGRICEIATSGSYLYAYSEEEGVWYTNWKDRLPGSEAKWIQAAPGNNRPIKMMTVAGSDVFILGTDSTIYHLEVSLEQ